MNNKLAEIFKIISFYDDYRWEFSHNYNLINFFKIDLQSDIKILTHWICYITDRQMPFQRIWDIGGFVFSELIYEVKKQNSLNLLNPEHENSFVKRDGNDKYTFISKSTAYNNHILTQYNGVFENGRVKFKSRFFPSDYLAIVYTFIFLEDYGFSFSKFIKEIYCKHKDKNDFIKRILFSLYLLTYYKIGQPKSGDLSDFAGNIKKANERKNRIKNILDNPDEFSNEYNIFLKDTVFNQKRAWCSLRDFLKSPEFKQYFEVALNDEDLRDNDFRKLFSYEALVQLELPGDVWNNNSKFRNCILKDTEYEHSKKALNKILRDFFNKNSQDIIGYPEQFDITFDFVPRMCDLNNCDLCPIYKIDNRKNDFNKICLKNKKMYCPVVLVGCNYKGNCKGEDNCKIV
ncbi:MAG: hypothetical protein U9P79_08350 [Candidatus Cloacimonadota bacterium]|nr:hypothetical protein [Thermodesulfobacteriota bacterium]MEA2104633.1 hypothetical protein [Candidatus Cloacimonadota bacterium]